MREHKTKRKFDNHNLYMQASNFFSLPFSLDRTTKGKVKKEKHKKTLSQYYVPLNISTLFH